ncbi:transcription initiation factor TFIID subunit 12 [Olea europaea var. sylvestris]|uniref:transcription initiation factor TFIID subunit 12 n=1 Tax=Olea europaea var. sylvestris TaxID=158386 RepID=UPI000C1D00EE|nr:transcription initiation factor TFIID subunit 12 [Olea europaea var. sylvestris]
MEQTPSTPPPAEQQQQPQQTPLPPPATTSSPSSSVLTPPLPQTPPVTTSSSNPSPTSTPKPPQSQPATPQTRPSFNTRPWQQPSSTYSHFSLPPPPLPSTSNPTTSISVPPVQRGGMAIGVPAQHPATSSAPPTSFSSLTSPSYGQQSQVRQSIQGMQGIGMTGSQGTTSAMRPGGIAAHQLRPGQSSLRPQTSSSSQSPTTPNFQGHGMLRVPSLGSPGLSTSGSSQSSQSQNQLWMSSGTQGRPPLPTPSLRPQASSQSLQQRSHIPQLRSITTSLQQQTNSTQHSPQPSTSGPVQENYGQQFPPSRMQQPLSHHQQIARGQGLGTQRPPLSMLQSSAVQPGSSNKSATADTEEFSTRIVSKRSIQELVSQIDPSEKLDPEVEDILVDIAEDFVESITTFGCSLAKHRKSTTLEAKDILLNLERNWNMTLPGYGGDEIKIYKKPFVSDIHRERLAAIKKSISATEMSAKSSSGLQGGNAKTHQAKGTASVIGSPPNAKIREAG